jgi:two-component system, chemotaxis family, CheB/CheR fusion protein
MLFSGRNRTTQHDDTYVIGIGASAGGLEAINELFDNISDSNHVAFIVVQHLSSDYKSLLVELLGKHTHMPVEEARHRQKVEAGKVYVIPNNKELTIHNGLLMLAEKEFDKGPNTAIDTFFQSLAQDQKEFAIAVVLSGTGTDGTRGIEAVKSCGGFVIVQDPETAKFDGMPKSAINSGYADLILDPSEIYSQIGNYIDGILPLKTPQSKKYNEYIQSILTIVYRKTGYDFLQYKEPTILRRITRRMQMVKVDDVEAYEKYIRDHDDEPLMLTREFFIGVTSFFRDKDAFDRLYREVIVRLVESKEDHESLKVWVTACSTGQEAYTVSILIDKALQQFNKTLDVKIFASDIDKSAIEFASKAKYQRNQLLGIDKKILNEYFTDTDDGWCVISRIRKRVVFATHDILKDPPFIKNDLVTCRNLLIYLNPPLQENVLATLYFALNKGGYLFLGTSENPSLLRKGFSEIDSKWKIYQRTSDQNIFTRRMLSSSRSRTSVTTTVAAKLKTDAQLAEDFKKVLADKLGYAGIYINENYEVKEAIGNFRKFLALPDKLSSLNIMKMAPPEMTGVLSTALRKSQKDNQAQSFRNVRVKWGEQQQLIDIFVYPPSETSSGVYTLVVLANSIVDNDKMQVPVQDLSILQKDQYVRQLEDELRETRTNLQMAIEGLETANEELQSSNEELQSANEELQSSNEELQSLNEELHTLNTEHQLRIKELVELNDDITNYLQTSLIGQIFLDQKLRIRRFNQAASAVINIIEGDIGRPIEHITHHIKASTFLEDIKKVSRTGQIIEREIELDNGLVYLIRFLPYIRQDKVRDGLVITMVDISAAKNLNRLIKSVFDASNNPILVFEAVRQEGIITDFVCSVANYTAYHSLGREVQEEKLSLKKDFPELSTSGLLKRYLDVVNSGEPASIEITFTKNGHKYWYQSSINKLQDGMVMVLSDITQRKEAEEKLRRNYNELLTAKETLRELNSQLEMKVKNRTRDLQASEERFRMVASLTNDVIWDWHFASNHLWWSESYYELFDFDTANPEVQAHSFHLQQIHPDDRSHVEEAFSRILQGLDKQFDIAYRYKKGDGEYAHVLDRGMLLTDDQGMPYRMIGAMVDVTRLEQSRQQLSQKNSELQSVLQQFRFVNDFMPQIVWAAQPDGHYDFYNQQWYDYTGMSSNGTKEKGWQDILHPEDFDRTWTNWQRSLQTGKPHEMEYRMRKFDGSYRWFLARALPMRDDQGNIVRWFGTCTDIHDQKIAERVLEDKVHERTRELRLLNEKLEASNSDLMQFASVASHDLKEPLRKIHFFTSLIKDQFPVETKGNLSVYIDRISRASSRATSLINDVLSYSRLSSENLYEKVDLNQVLQEILQDLDLVIQEKGATVHTGKLPIIQAVSGQMRQLFQNILSNSLKFHKPGQPPSITITSQLFEKNGYLEFKELKGPIHEITIKDEGIGFDEQYSKKIFSLFQRLNSKEKYEGTGIGLAIANKIIERHHGMITARGHENEGAEFIILLPEEQPETRQTNEEVVTSNFK